MKATKDRRDKESTEFGANAEQIEATVDKA